MPSHEWRRIDSGGSGDWCTYWDECARCGAKTRYGSYESPPTAGCIEDVAADRYAEAVKKRNAAVAAANAELAAARPAK